MSNGNSLGVPLGFTGESHPEIYEKHSSSNNKYGKLSSEQLTEYYENKEELEDVIADVKELVDDLANRLYSAGKVSDKYENLGFYERLTALEKEFPGANIVLHKTDQLTPAMRKIASNERLLNLIEDVIGENIAFNPVWNLRTKTPNSAATVVPWHQDSAYMDLDAYKIHIVTAWIPLIDANKENGTMQMVAGAHKKALVAVHTCCAGPTWYVDLEKEEMESRLECDIEKDGETLDVPFGSFILFNNFVPHRSLPNQSNQIRWSLDFRWQKAGTPGGIYGLKAPCIVRLKDNSELVPDFDAFDSVGRNSEQLKSVGKENDDFNTTISGPWMKQWHIVNHNRHTESFVDDESTWSAATVHG